MFDKVIIVGAETCKITYKDKQENVRKREVMFKRILW